MGRRRLKLILIALSLCQQCDFSDSITLPVSSVHNFGLQRTVSILVCRESDIPWLHVENPGVQERLEGWDVQQVREILNSLNVSYGFTTSDIHTAERQMSDGEHDIFLCSRTPRSERQMLVDFSDPYRSATVSVAMKHSKLQAGFMRMLQLVMTARTGCFLFLILMIAAFVGNIIWVIQRRYIAEFPQRPETLDRISDAFSWALAAITFLPFMRKQPAGAVSKVIGACSTGIGVPLMGLVVASIVSAIVLDLETPPRMDLSILKDQRVGVVNGSVAHVHLLRQGLEIQGFRIENVFLFRSLHEMLTSAMNGDAIDAAFHESFALFHAIGHNVEFSDHLSIASQSIPSLEIVLELQKHSVLRRPLNLALASVSSRCMNSKGRGPEIVGPRRSELFNLYSLIFWIILAGVVMLYGVSMLIRFISEPAAEVEPELHLAQSVRLASQESVSAEYQAYGLPARERRRLEEQINRLRRRFVDEAVNTVVESEMEFTLTSSPAQEDVEKDAAQSAHFITKDTGNRGFIALPSGMETNPQSTPGVTIKADLGYQQ